jgi:hypothetical protein
MNAWSNLRFPSLLPHMMLKDELIPPASKQELDFIAPMHTDNVHLLPKEDEEGIQVIFIISILHILT